MSDKKRGNKGGKGNKSSDAANPGNSDQEGILSKDESKDEVRDAKRIIPMDESTIDVEVEGQEEVCTPTDCAGAFVHSFSHSLVQGPIDGVTEVVNTIAGSRVIPKVELVKAPEKAEIGTNRWQAQKYGSGAGIITCLFVIGHMLTRRR